MPDPIDYTALADQARQPPAAPPVDYAALASKVREEPPSWLASIGQSLKDYGGELSSLNPAAIARGISQTVRHPIDTAANLLHAQGVVQDKATAAFQQGDYPSAVRHAINGYLLPVIGPRLDQASDDLEQGHYAKGLGAATDVALQTMGPKLLEQVPAIRTPLVGGAKLDATTAAAVKFGEDQGIPLDAATATNRGIVKVIQKRASDAMGGAGVAEAAKTNQANAFERVGGQLAEQVNPTPAGAPGAAVDPVSAGDGVRGSLQGTIADYGTQADTAYNTLRQIEQDPRLAQKFPTAPAGSSAARSILGKTAARRPRVSSRKSIACSRRWNRSPSRRTPGTPSRGRRRAMRAAGRSISCRAPPGRRSMTISSRPRRAPQT